MFRKFLIVAAIAAAGSFVVAQAPAAEKWWPSKWGKDDTLGAFNHLGPELTLKASKLVTTGKTYRLAVETTSKTPAAGTRTWEIFVVHPQVNDSFGDNKFTYFDDILAGSVGVGTQIDGLGHAGKDDIYYNGHKAKDFGKLDGLTTFGVEHFPPIVTRGVMLDMVACMGNGKMLPGGTVFNRAEIKACEEKQGVKIEKGDVVLFNTGWISILMSDSDRFKKEEPGIGIDGAKYLAEKDVIAVGADNWALEVLPAENEKVQFGVHQELLTFNGIYILEYIDTSELAKDKAYEFMFVLGTTRIKGGVQALINPIAIR